MDFALFVLRIVVGALFVGHGTQKLFGWFGGYGLDGTGAFMEKELRYRPGRTHAMLAGVTETAAGAMLVLGLFVPLAAAGIVGGMVNAIGAVHAPNGPWIDRGGYEYTLVLLVNAVVLAWTGPGDIALTELGGPYWAVFALGLGMTVGLAMLAMREADIEEERETGEPLRTRSFDLPDDRVRERQQPVPRR